MITRNGAAWAAWRTCARIVLPCTAMLLIACENEAETSVDASMLETGPSPTEDTSKETSPVTTPDASLPDAEVDAAVVDCTTTWKAIQHEIFNGKGCTAAACHGSAASGGLHLSAADALDQLVNVKAQAALTKPMYRVTPGEQALSLLYLKLAAAADPKLLPTGGGSPMPVGQPPLTEKQLTAVKLWIRAGAPKEGVVAGTQELLSCDIPDSASPNKSPRPPIPSPMAGFQVSSGPWTLEANTDDEVCFATYYDITSSAPDWSRIPCAEGDTAKSCVAYKRRQLSQDAQSHHSIISIYMGSAKPSDPAWGAWRCVGGASSGTTCDPTAATNVCGEGICQSEPKHVAACVGWGPEDKDTTSLPAGGAQSPVSTNEAAEGVYARVPLKGVIIWNSHGFNLTKTATTIDQYNTFWYANESERVYPAQGIFDTSNIYAMTVPPFQEQEICGTYTVPRYAHVTSLSSHVHKRGVRFRLWLPPNDPNCSAVDKGDGKPICKPNESAHYYQSLEYSDPVILYPSPHLSFEQADVQSRTFKYCGLFDNGKRRPDLLKRNSLLPNGVPPCAPEDTYCFGGDKQGTRCNGDHAVCGPNGSCDACTVRGGVKTEDEMFIPVGELFVKPPL